MLQQYFARPVGALTFSALTILFVSCSGTQSNTIPATVQSQAVAGRHVSDASVMAGDRAYRALHYVANPLPANFVPSAIMRNGRIPGSFGKQAAFYQHARIYQLGSFKGLNTTALFMNDRGEAVGYAGPLVDALLFANCTIVELQPQPTGPDGPYVTNVATAISDTGAIYGNSNFLTGFYETVQFSPHHAAVRLPDQPVGLTEAIGFIDDINRSGTFAYQHTFGDAPVPPVGAVGKGLLTSYPFNQRASGATSVNDHGTVAGYIDPVDEPYTDAPDFPNFKAFVRAGGSLTILPYLPGATIMEATGLNNHDDAVGSTGCQWDALPLLGRPGCLGGVFVYTHGKLYDAAKLLPTLFSSPVSLLSGLSDHGEFVVMKGSTYYLVSPH
jgi:hypothetical protein